MTILLQILLAQSKASLRSPSLRLLGSIGSLPHVLQIFLKRRKLGALLLCVLRNLLDHLLRVVSFTRRVRYLSFNLYQFRTLRAAQSV